MRRRIAPPVRPRLHEWAIREALDVVERGLSDRGLGVDLLRDPEAETRETELRNDPAGETYIAALEQLGIPLHRQDAEQVARLILDECREQTRRLKEDLRRVEEYAAREGWRGPSKNDASRIRNLLAGLNEIEHALFGKLPEHRPIIRGQGEDRPGASLVGCRYCARRMDKQEARVSDPLQTCTHCRADLAARRNPRKGPLDEILERL